MDWSKEPVKSSSNINETNGTNFEINLKNDKSHSVDKTQSTDRSQSVDKSKSVNASFDDKSKSVDASSDDKSKSVDVSSDDNNVKKKTHKGTSYR